MQTSNLIKSLEKTLILYAELPPRGEDETDLSRVQNLFNKVASIIQSSTDDKQISTLTHFLRYIESQLDSTCLSIFTGIFPKEHQTTEVVPVQSKPIDPTNDRLRIVTHSSLEKLMRVLGFIGNPEGVCDGIAKVSLEYLVCEKMDLFNKNLGYIAILFEQLQSERMQLDRITLPQLQEVCKRISPSLYSKLQTFLCKIDLAFNARLYPNVLAHSKSFDDSVQKLGNVMGLYTKEQLLGLLSNLQALSIRAEKLFHSPLAFHLSYNFHALSIGYNIKHQNWFFVDVNQLCKSKIDKLEEVLPIAFQSSLPLLLSITIYSKKLTGSIPSFVYDQIQTLHRSSQLIAQDQARFISNRGMSLLHLACQQGHLDFVRILLAKEGININQASSSGVTPLYMACYNGHLDIVQELLAREDIFINQADSDGNTPLHIVCCNGHLGIVQALIAKEGVRINQADSEGVTPLYVACYKGHLDIVQALLVAEGIDVNQAKTNGVTPLYIACCKGHLDIVQALIAKEGININQAKTDGVTPLYAACYNGYQDIVQALIAKEGIDINQADSDGITPLYMACKKGCLEIVKFLLRKGANLHRTESAVIEVAIAKKLGYVKIVEVLEGYINKT